MERIKKWFGILFVIIVGLGISKNVYASSKVFLQDVECIDSGKAASSASDRPRDWYDSGTYDYFGNFYKYAFRFDGSTKDWGTYRLGKKYTKFEGILATGKQPQRDERFTGSGAKINVYVYGDDKLLYSYSNLTLYTNPVKFSIDVSGVEKLHIEATNSGAYYCGWMYFCNSYFIKGYEIKLDKKTYVLNPGESAYIKCTVNKNNQPVDKKVSFSSDKINVAKVSSKGKIVAVNAGSCKIKCKAGYNTEKITVIVLPVKVTGIKNIKSGTNSVQLSWTRKTGVNQYQIYMYDPDLEEFTKVKTAAGSSKSAVIKNLKRNTTYTFKIRGIVKYNGKRYYGDFSSAFKARTR